MSPELAPAVGGPERKSQTQRSPELLSHAKTAERVLLNK